MIISVPMALNDKVVMRSQAQLETQVKAINQHVEELLQTDEEPEHKGEFSTPTRALGRLGNEGFWDGDFRGGVAGCHSGGRIPGHRNKISIRHTQTFKFF